MFHYLPYASIIIWAGAQDFLQERMLAQWRLCLHNLLSLRCPPEDALDP